MISIQTVPVVYLAGGSKSGWQDKVTAAVPGVIFLDPRDHNLADEHKYTAWDLAAVDRCDIVFGYMEATNPGGSGLAVEFGWGGKAGKKLILVEESGYAQERYFGMVRSLAHKHIRGEDALAQGIAYLQGVASHWGAK